MSSATADGEPAIAQAIPNTKIARISFNPVIVVLRDRISLLQPSVHFKHKIGDMSAVATVKL